jgi:hypothetical protein
MHRRHFVAVILVYLACDLCLASMPGAFVFDAADAVESTSMGRARPVRMPAATFRPASTDEPTGTPPRQGVRRDVVRTPCLVRHLAPRRDAGVQRAGSHRSTGDDPH